MSTEREEMRHYFIDAWQKHQSGEALSNLEQHIISVIEQHPEYHELLNSPEEALQKDYGTDENPFLHLMLHLSLLELLASDNPAGILGIYEKLCKQEGDPHEAEHQMLDIMANLLWDAQEQGQMPDEQDYLEQLKGLIKGKQ